jgi:hypothetical protein
MGSLHASDEDDWNLNGEILGPKPKNDENDRKGVAAEDHFFTTNDSQARASELPRPKLRVPSLNLRRLTLFFVSVRQAFVSPPRFNST